MRFFVLFLLFFAAMPAMAQTLGGGKSPVEIEASQQLEWLREQNMYRANGDVMIKQGTTIIHGDNAEAAYDPEKGNSALTTITITGNVVITDLDRTIHADKAVYDTATENLLLTGNAVTLKTLEMTVTAQNNMQYDAKAHLATASGNAEVLSKAQQVNADTIVATLNPQTNKLNKATATGHAQIINGEQKLKADTVTGWMDETTGALQRAEAEGHVVITKTSTEGTDIAQAQQGEYDAVKNIIVLKGNVKITRGGNHMQGDQATIDIASGHSALMNLPGKNSGGRVKAIFSSNGDTAPKMTGGMPMINGKKSFEPAYALGRTDVVNKNDQ